MINKKLVVLTENGFLTQIEPNKKKTTDKIIFEGTSEECQNVIHGKRRR